MKNDTGWRGFLSRYAGVITAAGALVAAGIAFLGQSGERNRLRRADVEAQERMVAQRKSESDRDLAARFSQLLLDLGSESDPVRAGAVVSLLGLLGNGDPTLRRQVRLATLANLKVSHPMAIMKLLRRTLAEALGKGVEVPYDPIELDFSGADLSGAPLSGLVLEGALLEDTLLCEAQLQGCSLRGALGRRTRLEGVFLQGKDASLFNAQLPEARCRGARFQGAELVNLHMENADLRAARFEGARLQAAHFEFADLRGAYFEGANLADTYFLGCRLDDNALRSMLTAKNWEKAHLDPNPLARLKQLRTQTSKPGAEKGKK